MQPAIDEQAFDQAVADLVGEAMPALCVLGLLGILALGYVLGSLLWGRP